MNMLCNPTGKPNAFQPIDWLVERNNLYTKVSRIMLSNDTHHNGSDPGYLRGKWPESNNGLYLPTIPFDRSFQELSHYSRVGVSAYALNPQAYTPRHDHDD